MPVFITYSTIAGVLSTSSVIQVGNRSTDNVLSCSGGLLSHGTSTHSHRSHCQSHGLAKGTKKSLILFSCLNNIKVTDLYACIFFLDWKRTSYGELHGGLDPMQRGESNVVLPLVMQHLTPVSKFAITQLFHILYERWLIHILTLIRKLYLSLALEPFPLP